MVRRRWPLPARGERMLNEICDAIEAMASEETLIFVFEDLHWADLSTLDLISALARRRQAARLLLLASYRPAEVSAGQHPLKRLKQDLVTHKLCADVSLGSAGKGRRAGIPGSGIESQESTGDAPQGVGQLRPPALLRAIPCS